MGYRLTWKAADDLRPISVEGIKLFGAPQAARYHDRLQQAFETVGQNPQMMRERSEISPFACTRAAPPCGSHVIVSILGRQRRGLDPACPAWARGRAGRAMKIVYAGVFREDQNRARVARLTAVGWVQRAA